MNCKKCGKELKSTNTRGYCKICFLDTEDYKLYHNAKQKEYCQRHPDYVKRCAQSRRVWYNKLKQNEPRYEELLRKHSLYAKTNIVSKCVTTERGVVCPICKRVGSIRVQYKVNNKCGSKNDFSVYCQHYSPFFTCYLSKDKYPERELHIKYAKEELS